MANETPVSPFALLYQIERRCLSLAADLPKQEVVQSWSGIGFRLGQRRYVTPMEDIAEILPQPPCTGLPGVKSWVKGVANLRGRLLPVVDLCGFFGQSLTSQRKQQRILAIEQAETFVGLLVDEVFGMQYFLLDSFEEKPEELNSLDANISPFVYGAFLREKPWFVFNPHALVADTAFQQVAA